MADLSDLRRQLRRKAEITGRNTASDVESRLRRESPLSSGNMRAQTTAKSTATTRGALIDIKVDTPYAHIVRSGQRPHVITPRNPGGVLVFQSRGETRFARSVNHPGAQGRSWWDDTLRATPDILARNWRGVR